LGIGDEGFKPRTFSVFLAFWVSQIPWGDALAEWEWPAGVVCVSRRACRVNGDGCARDDHTTDAVDMCSSRPKLGGREL